MQHTRKNKSHTAPRGPNGMSVAVRPKAMSDAPSTVDGSGPDDERAFWDGLGAKRLASGTVALDSAGGVSTEPLESALARLGLRTAPEGELAVVLTDDYLQTRLGRFNEEFLAGERPWLLAKLVGTIVWIGPLFRPGQTGCWECLAERLRGSRQVETYVQQRLGIRQPIPGIGRLLETLP